MIFGLWNCTSSNFFTTLSKGRFTPLMGLPEYESELIGSSEFRIPNTYGKMGKNKTCYHGLCEHMYFFLFFFFLGEFYYVEWGFNE